MPTDLLASAQAKARHTAAQAVAAIATIDLPHNQWPELIQGLVNNVTNTNNAYVKQSSLEALGYICEEIVRCSLLPDVEASARGTREILSL